MEIISICLSDIPKEARTTAKNGKVYANFVVDKRREPDKFGNTLTVCINQTKEERAAKKDKIYVGSGKEFLFNQSPNLEPAGVPTSDDGDDLPF